MRSSLVDIWKCIRRRAHWAKSKWVFVEEGGLGNVAKCNVGWGLEGGRGEINWWACFELLPLLHSSCVWIWLTHRRGAHQLSPARAQQFLDTSLETAFPDLAASTEWLDFRIFCSWNSKFLMLSLTYVRYDWYLPISDVTIVVFEEILIDHQGNVESHSRKCKFTWVSKSCCKREMKWWIASTLLLFEFCILLWGAVSHAVGLFFSQQGTMVCWHTGGKLDADEAVPCAAWSRSLNSFTPITFLFAATQSSGLSSTSHSHRVEDFCQKPA